MQYFDAKMEEFYEQRFLIEKYSISSWLANNATASAVTGSLGKISSKNQNILLAASSLYMESASWNKPII